METVKLITHSTKNYNTIGANEIVTQKAKVGAKSTTWMIYLSHGLSSWGDRMWSFAVGLYLVILFPDSLQLTAIYGFIQCLSVILLGAFIGNWIDMSPRITAARVSLLIQNTSVIAGAISLALTLLFNQEIKSLWNGYLEILIFAIIIILAVIAELGSVANTIALEKDWIVVLSGGDESQLSNLNATMRTIDLTTFILAPIFVGQIITYLSQITGALVIAFWNLASVIIEYFLLSKIYQLVPGLSEKEIFKTQDDAKKLKKPQDSDMMCEKKYSKEMDVLSLSSNSTSALFLKNSEECNSKRSCTFHIYTQVTESLQGWKSYFSHPVRYAGLGLAMLYMTVLGFDSITIGFAYTQGVDESLLGIVTAVGAVLGILGSVSFPCLRRIFGKNTTGNIGFFSETVCLLLCVVSVFAQGSPFKPEAILDPFNINSNSTGSKESQVSDLSLTQLWNEHTTVFYLLGGIILARYGLWVADLSVTQIFQEQVNENERGILNGVQGSLNQLMNLLKFLLVIILPAPETFGYLIFASWAFGVVGWILFGAYVIKQKKTHTFFQNFPENEEQ